MRGKGNDTRGSKITSRKWVDEEFGVVMGYNGEDWKSIAVSQRWLNLKDSVMRHVLVSPYGIFEILMGSRDVGGIQGGTTNRGDWEHRELRRAQYIDPVDRWG